MGIHGHWWHPHTHRPGSSGLATAWIRHKCIRKQSLQIQTRRSNSLSWPGFLFFPFRLSESKEAEEARGWSRGGKPWDFCSDAKWSEPSVGPLTKPEARQGFLCLIINANAITVTLTVLRGGGRDGVGSPYIIFWHMKMNAAIHHCEGLNGPHKAELLRTTQETFVAN